jgi:hypothetical protein
MQVTRPETVSEEAQERLTNPDHWGYWSAMRGVFDASGVHGAPAPAIHFAPLATQSKFYFPKPVWRHN